MVLGSYPEWSAPATGANDLWGRMGHNPDGTWDGNRAHDYRCLAKSLDLIRPMTYDEHWGTSTAGPVSSPEFSEMVDRNAVSVSSEGSVELGIAAYGYDWKGKEGRSITWDDLVALKKKGVKITRDEETAELTARYTDEKGQARELWFCDAYSYRPKYAIIKKYKLAGMAIWRFGSEDPTFWTDVRAFKYAKNW
jgi:spore germination protein YaaH